VVGAFRVSTVALWGNDYFIRMAVQPCTPPAEGAVGNDGMAAAAHQEQILIIGVVSGDIYSIRAEKVSELSLHTGDVVRKDEEQRVGSFCSDELHCRRIVLSR